MKSLNVKIVLVDDRFAANATVASELSCGAAPFSLSRCPNDSDGSLTGLGEVSSDRIEDPVLMHDSTSPFSDEFQLNCSWGFPSKTQRKLGVFMESTKSFGRKRPVKHLW